MNDHLSNAINELKKLNAYNLPTPEQVEKAADRSDWDGKLSDGGTWKLVKNKEDSYTITTQN
jgi:hypothetical protein